MAFKLAMVSIVVEVGGALQNAGDDVLEPLSNKLEGAFDDALVAARAFVRSNLPDDVRSDVHVRLER